MAGFKTLDDLEVKGKRVLVRLDLNVPMKDGAVSDVSRLERSAQTIKDLMSKGARVVIVSHFGRPKGERVADMSLRPVAEVMSRVIEVPIAFAEDCIGPAARMVVNALVDGQVAVLENLRYHRGEEENDPDFARQLAALGDIYVNDAFSAAHRAHASTEAIAQILPNAAGRLMQAELEALERALEHPEKPLAALVGGAKVSTKLVLLETLLDKVDVLMIGGGMANTFLYAQGKDVGASLCEKAMAETVCDILKKADVSGCRLVVPTDAVVAENLTVNAPNAVVSVEAVPADTMILDIGPNSVETLKILLAECKTLLWNGPLGAFESPPFDAATNAVAQAAAVLTREGALLSVAGGGETVSALTHAGVIDDFSYVSAAGGAFLEWVEGKELPGVAALTTRGKYRKTGFGRP